MGLDIYLKGGTKTKSVTNPEHLCTPSYLRSSYNDAGFNQVVESLIGESLYSIFCPPDGEYNWSPTDDELRAAHARALNVAQRLRGARGLRAVEIGDYFGDTVKSSAQALALVEKALAESEAKQGIPMRSYSSRDGHFYLDGLEIVAAIPGRGVLGGRATYLVYKADLTWYVETALITAEFCEHALEIPKRRITWSG